ncbi:MAG TPA: hypothetical protein VFP09_11385 [Desertimonas sp.]|nr:hypothetical protein [Desertimonas sp.]
MADTKISALTAVTTPAGTDEFAVNQGGSSKRLTLAQVATYLQSGIGLPRITRLGSQHSISSATGTEVTGLSQTLEAGTYVFRYHLIIRQATATTDAPQFGINFTGTSTTKNFILSFSDAATALTANTYIMDNVGIKTAGFMDAMAHNALSTTAPNMGTTVGVAATAADILCFIDGLIIVTVSGDLELWRSSEGANASTTEIGSSLVVIRTA